MSLLDSAIVRALPAVPKPVVRRLSARYIAGPELADARRVVAELNAAGKRATVDVLGEEITRADEAHEITQAYLDMLDAIDDDGLDANVSVKLTGLGLEVDPVLCRENLAAIAERGTFVRIDMEDSSTTDATLELYRDLTDEGFANLGVVLQSALKRTEDDARALAGANVRLCKGIYIEPPEISYRDFDDIRESYVAPSSCCSTAAATWASRRTTSGWSSRACGRCASGGSTRGVRVPDAPRRPPRARRPPRPRRAPAKDLRPLRPPVVRVLAPEAAGEPKDRRLCGRRSRTLDLPQTVGAYGGGGPGGPLTTSSSSTTVVSRRGATVRRRTAGPPST